MTHTSPEDTRDAESSLLDDRSILVTGATGSFGNRFVKTVLSRYKPRRLIVYSRDEFKQVLMQRRYSVERYPELRYFIGDVRDRDRLRMAMRDVDVVIHAAALKHVPAVEYNPFECIHTNVIGAENVVTAALDTGVDRVIALSTDKAANPINLYGASKLAADKIFVAANHLSAGKGPRFSVVRYGNVVGSRGSIVPYFRELAAGGSDHLPITDRRMTRFFIELQAGVDFVLACLGRMLGGEIFIPKIPSVRIVDLATAVAPDLEQRVIGIRPGEKLHEVMVPSDDARTTLDLDSYYVMQPYLRGWSPDQYLELGAAPVPDDFCYASDTNDVWLGVEALRGLLDGLEA